MSESKEHFYRNFSKFDEMSTEELNEILRQDSQLPDGEDSDTDAILYIMGVIAKRNQELPSSDFGDVNHAWSSFNKNYRFASSEGCSLFDFDDEPQLKRGGCRFAWGFLAGFVTAAVVAAVAWFCLFGVVKKPSSQPAVIADDTAKVAAADSDSTAAVEKPQEQSEEKTAEPEKESKKAEQTFKVTNTAYLSNISRKFYGHYAFWVYIYLDNKDIITDPDNLPVGAELRIPAPEKYGIDKNNPESIRRAEIKALEIKNGK